MSENTLEITQYHFCDLVDVQAFSKMLEDFHKATHIANGVVGNDGELITTAGWASACVDFHRMQAESNQRCVESNIELIDITTAGSSCGKQCANGMLDYATPVVIEGYQIATLFLGQVFHEEPDLEHFRAQAQRFGYDEEKYIEAIKAVPVVSKSHVEALMKCLADMAGMLAESGLARLRQQRLERDLTAHKEREIQLEDILSFSPVAIGWSNDKTGKIEYFNQAFERLFGYTIEDIPDLDTWYKKAYPDREYRKRVIEPWVSSTGKRSSSWNMTKPVTIDAEVTCKDGSLRHVHMGVTWVGNRRLVSFSNVTDHWLAEKRLHAHGRMLEMVAKDAPLTDILNAIVHQVENEAPDSLCSVLLMSEDGWHLLSGSAPSLPDFYNKAIHGVEIGNGVGSCGTAAYLGQRVIVEDISSHEYWADFAGLAAEAGLAACWSDPIMSSSGRVLGTFAIYHPYPATPSEKDIELISFASNLASIAIESSRTHKELERRAYYDYLTGLPNRRYFFELAEHALMEAKLSSTPLSIVMMDVDHFKMINDRYGHKVGDIVLQELSSKCREVLRKDDHIGRIGGEEFAILLPHTGYETAFELAEKLRCELADMVIHSSRDQDIRFTVSLGVSECHEKCAGYSIDSLLSRADKALYHAKSVGRNCVWLDGAD